MLRQHFLLAPRFAHFLLKILNFYRRPQEIITNSIADTSGYIALCSVIVNDSDPTISSYLPVACLRGAVAAQVICYDAREKAGKWNRSRRIFRPGMEHSMEYIE
jgi:hypothetical protein